MRDFAKKLPANSLYDRVAVIGYYVANYQDKTVFSANEMKSWFQVCGFPLPKQRFSVVLTDTRRFHDYVENKGRDQWSITPNAHNLVLRMLENLKGE